MRAVMLVGLAVLAVACDSATVPPYTLRIYIGGDEGHYDLTIDDAAATPLDAAPNDVNDTFLFERTYPSYGAAVEATPIEATILDRATGATLDTATLGPGDCERLGIEDLTYEEQSYHLLPDGTLGGGCVQCRGEDGSGGASCP